MTRSSLDAALVPDRHGVPVLHRSWPVDAPRACVVLSHGASEHSGRYARFARALNDAGVDVHALDHRGHGGTSAATGVGRAGAGGGEALLDDLEDLLDRAADEHPGVPLVLFGHSLGAVLALACATRREPRLAGLVLSGFPVSLAGADAFRAGFQGAVDAGMAEETMSLAGYNEQFEPARTPVDWLSRDDAEVDAYLADPYCGDRHPLTLGLLAALFDALVPGLQPDALPHLRCPVLLVTGGSDPAAGNGEHARELEAALRQAGVDVQAHVYDGARHEVLNETNRDEVTADVLAWLDRVVRT